MIYCEQKLSWKNCCHCIKVLCGHIEFDLRAWIYGSEKHRIYNFDSRCHSFVSWNHFFWFRFSKLEKHSCPSVSQKLKFLQKLQCKCNASSMQVQCNWYTSVMKCKCYASVMQGNASAMKVLCKFYAGAIW